MLRLHRRQYRLDLKTADAPCSIAQEVEDVLAVANAVGEPVIVVRSLLRREWSHWKRLPPPRRSFAGAVIFEPATVIGAPLAGADGETITRARAAIAAGKPGAALAIFVRDTVGLPPWQARLAGALTALVPRYRDLVPAQIDDLEALDQLGNRLDGYAQITVPTLLLSGDRSPAHLATGSTPSHTSCPTAERVVMHGKGHAANRTAPGEVARIIETLADRVLR